MLGSDFLIILTYDSIFAQYKRMFKEYCYYYFHQIT